MIYRDKYTPQNESMVMEKLLFAPPSFALRNSFFTLYDRKFGLEWIRENFKREVARVESCRSSAFGGAKKKDRIFSS